MSAHPIRVLCIEDNPGDVTLVKLALAETGSSFIIEWEDRLSRGLSRLARNREIDAVLLDLGLPDSRGLETLVRTQTEAPWAPIVVLTNLDDDPSDLAAVTAGAQDYLSKDTLDGGALARAIRHAIGRAHLLANAQSARLEAERASAAKDVLLATIAHELRSPLHTALGWTQLMQMGRLDEPTTQHALSIIERCALHQARLVDDLLDISRAVLGTMRVELAPVRLGSVVREAVDIFEHLARVKGIDLELRINDRDDEVFGDADRLRQVVGNLLANAIKFTNEGGAVSVDVRPAGERARISVTDMGSGITAELLPHVFEKFRKGVTTQFDALGGLGLGLAIAKHIVILHGGTISAFSPGPGQGATFTVELSLARFGNRIRPS